jgi:tRNA C32,U32 (ribose-2'-O)-methylase TrmJ
LNLAQAVLLLAYELRLESLARPAGPPPASAERAAAGQVEQALLELRGALVEIGYLAPANPDRILAELRRLVARAEPSPRDVVLLRGLARQIAWAGRVARNGTGVG